MKRWIISVITISMFAVLSLMPGVQAATSFKYVSMGDSVAAGAGLPAPATRSAEDAACDRTAQAYPNKVAARLGVSVLQLACSGAKTDEGIYGEQELSNGTELTPQLDRAFAQGTPNLITMTVGANDARWVQFLQQCYLTVCGTSFDDARAKIYRADLRVELFWTMYRIHYMSGENPPAVLMNGYYMPFNNVMCGGTENITLAERAWLNARTADLNQAIYSVAILFPNTAYVPVSFQGHELCSSDPWIQGANASAPFHPTARGQTAIANANLRAIGR